MSTVTSRLSRQQEKQLCFLLNCSRLSLLFKASVHGYTADAFHRRCDWQGPTVTVAYNNSWFIFGAYTSKYYAQTGQNIADDKAFVFSFNEREMKKKPLRVVSTEAQRSFIDAKTGPNFVSLLFLYNNTATVYSNPGTYNFNPVEIHGNNLQLTEFEVYRVEAGAEALMEKPWRNIQWDIEKKKGLMDMITEWKHGVSSVKKARILLVGPVGAGKSSFYNSINSVFKGYVSNQANMGYAGTSLTTQFRAYSIKTGGGKVLPFTLCDTMGLEEGINAGLDIDDFVSILKGHIQNKYQFNPAMPLQTQSPSFCKEPELKDKIHTVVYVIDTCNVKLLSEKVLEKLAAFRRKTNQLGIPQIFLMTKVDEACPSVASDLKNLYQSNYIHKMMQEVSANLGVPLSNVIPVKNYSQDVDLDPQTDILLLNAFVQILRTTEGFFEDFSQEEE
ncbi:interferon-induced protein 44-like isoform X2 [Astyanax mexicanus]|uniref:interferon-induced protein 44-like isoform X2 n=1 Tax=Astyanax mexicanus TaxID=7994 RepID=UPI0020CAB581|nr:interferon-induced protein 44-like isoform X2 [Astyanax mexicanus]